MNQHSRRISRSDIFDRHEWAELFGFATRIPAGDRFWPLTGLAAEIIENAAVTFPLPRIAHRRAADLRPCFFGGDFPRIVTRMRTGRCIPIADQIAVAEIGQEHARARLNSMA